MGEWITQFRGCRIEWRCYNKLDAQCPLTQTYYSTTTTTRTERSDAE